MSDFETVPAGGAPDNVAAVLADAVLDNLEMDGPVLGPGIGNPASKHYFIDRPD